MTLVVNSITKDIMQDDRESIDEQKCIKVSIIGSPNVGKSSLLNYIVQNKNSIVSPKPHTTRSNIMGVVNVKSTQIVFMDTPGYIRSGTGIWANHFIQAVQDAMNEVDVNLMIVDPTKINAYGTETMLHAIANDPKTIIALNKVDIKSKGKLYPLADKIMSFGYKDIVYLISAKTGDGVDDLVSELVKRAPKRQWVADNNSCVQDSKQRYAAECVREKLFYTLNQELPFQLWTNPVSWKFSKKGWSIHIDIVVTKIAHKKIIIGHKGTMLKTVGIAARAELESIWGPGQLFLNVRQDISWMSTPEYIHAICEGYSIGIGPDV